MPVARSTRSGALRHQLGDLLQVEGQVWGAGGLRREAVERTGAREPLAQADVCRPLAREHRLKDVIAKKL